MTYWDFDEWLVEQAKRLPGVRSSTIAPANYLDISRHIAHIRNKPDNNWLALALEKIQESVRAVQKAVT